MFRIDVEMTVVSYDCVNEVSLGGFLVVVIARRHIARVLLVGHALEQELVALLLVELEGLAVLVDVVEALDVVDAATALAKVRLHVEANAQLAEHVKRAGERRLGPVLGRPALVVIGDVLAPGEVAIVHARVVVHVEEVLGELFGRVEVEHVYEGRARHVARVVAVAEHDRHDVVVERAEELLRHVLGAQRVLEGEEELVLGRYEAATVDGAVQRTLVATVAEHVHVDVAAELFDQVAARRRRYAVADQRSRELCLSLRKFI